MVYWLRVLGIEFWGVTAVTELESLSNRVTETVSLMLKIEARAMEKGCYEAAELPVLIQINLSPLYSGLFRTELQCLF